MVTFCWHVWTDVPAAFCGHSANVEWMFPSLHGRQRVELWILDTHLSVCSLLVSGKPRVLMLSMNMKCIRTWQWEIPSVGFQGCKWVIKAVCILSTFSLQVRRTYACLPSPYSYYFFPSCPAPAPTPPTPEVECLMEDVPPPCLFWTVRCSQWSLLLQSRIMILRSDTLYPPINVRREVGDPPELWLCWRWFVFS